LIIALLIRIDVTRHFSNLNSFNNNRSD